MTKISEPYINMPIVGAQTPVANAAQRILIAGQMTAAGSATEGALNRSVTPDGVAALVGEGSMLEDAYTGLREINEVTPVDIIAMDDLGAGTTAIGSISAAGTATAAGEYEITIGSERNGKALVAIEDEDTAAEAATKIAAAFADLGKCVCAVAVDGTTVTKVNATYRHKGLEGNFVPISIKGTVPGLALTITAMTGGAGTPDLSTLFDVVSNQRYQQVVIPGSWGVTELSTFLDGRFNVANKIMDGVGYVTVADAVANDLIDDLEEMNSKCVVVFADKVEAQAELTGPSKVENLFARSAMFAAVDALRMTPEQDISEYITAGDSPLDLVGGPALATLPYFNTPLPVPVSLPGVGWEQLEIEAIKTAGGSVIGDNVSGTATIVGEVVTTYKFDNAGNPDITFKYLNTVKASSVGREYMFNQLKRDCAQSRLTEGDLIAGRSMNNEASLTAKFVKYYSALSGAEYCITEAGEEALQYFIRNLTIQINKATGTVTASMKVPIVTQLRTIVVPWQISFSTAA